MFKEKTGFVYLWRDRKYNKYYVGCHWGREDDTYVCSSNWMKRAYDHRPEDFKRRVIARTSGTHQDLLDEEFRWLSMIKQEELKIKYYNLQNHHYGHWSSDEEKLLSISEKMKGNKNGLGKPCSEEKRQKIIKATTGVSKTMTPALIAANIARIGVSIHTDEWKEEQSERLKQQWADGVRTSYTHGPCKEETKEKIRLSNTGKVATEDQRKAQSEARKALWADPAYREKMTAIRQTRKKMKYKPRVAAE